MATPKRAAQRHTPSARASSAREERFERMKRAEAGRPDPVQEQRRMAEERAKNDPLAPKPQQGISSSELNSAPQSLKDKATEEAADKPVNYDPSGAHKAGTDAAKTGLDKPTQPHT